MVHAFNERVARVTGNLLPVALGCGIALTAASACADSHPQAVLLLDQSGPGVAAYTQIDEAFRANLHGRSVTIYGEKLDLNLFGSESYNQVLTTFIHDKYREIPIDVIVAIGAKALDAAYSLRAHTQSTTPIVFAAIADALIDRARLPPNVTGRTVQTSFATFLDSARILVPNLRQVALVGDPLERQTYRSHFRREVLALKSLTGVIDLTGLPMPVVKERVANLPPDSAILFTTLYVDGEGTIFSPRQALKTLAAVANRPIVVDVSTHVGNGATGGFVLNAAEAGREAAQLVSRLLQGEDAARVPVAQSDAIKPVFDWKQLQRWNVSEARLPAGSEVLFRELSVWQRYRWQIIFLSLAFVLQSSLVGVLFYEDRARQKAVTQSFQLMSELARMDRVAIAGEMSASIAHEVRQPLAAIVTQGNAGLRWLSRQTPDVEEVRKSLQSIVDEGHRADKVIKNVRAIFTNDINTSSSVDVNRLIEKVLALTSLEARKHNITLNMELGEKPLPQVLGNEVQLQQVVMNIVLNAIEAVRLVPRDGRMLTVTSARSPNREVTIKIEDSGPGIEPAVAEDIFKPFFSTKRHGMGMGLSICKSIVEAHGGRLTTVPSTHGGAGFQIVIPANGEAKEPGPADRIRH
jgi:signal transduction histidine kinase